MQHMRSIPLTATMHPPDPFALFERQSKQLRDDLQELLDSQSRALSARQILAPSEDTPSTRSSTPTLSHVPCHRPALPVPVRQPRKKEISLKNARRGILRSIDSLLCVKEEEHDILNAEVHAREEALKVVKAFMDKRAGLQRSITGMKTDSQKQRVDSLSNELHTLEGEIRDTETKLAQMKMRHQRISNEISELQNTFDSKLSSYEGSLTLVDSDAKRYLRTPPIPLLKIIPSSVTFYSLPPERRTLEIAEEHWTQEISALQERILANSQEIEALRKGGRIWNDTVNSITSTERIIRSYVNRICGKGFHEQFGPRAPTDADITYLLGQITAIIHRLEKDLRLAEGKNWTLLICGLGAELEAFLQAKEMFTDRFRGVIDTMDEDHGGTQIGQVPEEFLRPIVPQNADSPSPKADQSTYTSDQPYTHPEVPPLITIQDRIPGSDDDEPDPTWLLSPT